MARSAPEESPTPPSGAGPTAPGAAASLDEVGGAVADRIAGFLSGRMAHLVATDPSLEPLGAAVGRLVAAGGKRLRPAFVYWGHRATGAGHDDAVYTPAAAVELVHAFALIHDDVMDHSPIRRGLPAAHVAFADAHRRQGLTGDAGWFGISGAILAGDLATAWAAQLFDESRFPAAAMDRAREVFSRMQVEVIAGQYLELWLTGRAATESEALQVGLLKSGRYTVTRPLQLGAALGGGGTEIDRALTEYGDAVGLAFQLRDDILGLFGDPQVTGKSTLDDVREGKRTLLAVWALERAAPGDRRDLDRRLGSADITDADVDVVREIVVRTGALADVEKLLGRYRLAAGRALAGVPTPAREALAEMAELALERST